MSQQIIVAVAITLAVVAVILVIALLWPLGRLPGHDGRQAVALPLWLLASYPEFRFIALS